MIRTESSTGRRRRAARRPPGPIARRLAVAMAVAAVALALAGCDRPGFVAEPLIAEPPATLLEAGALFEATEVLGWSLADPREARVWKPRPGTTVERTAAGLAVHPRGRSATLDCRIDLDTATIDAIELTVADGLGVSAAVQWAAQGERFGPDRMVLVADPRVEDRPSARIRLPLRGAPGWRGPIARLRLRLAIPTGRELVVRRVAAVAETPSGRLAPAAVAEHGWLAGLGAGGEVRSALLALPGVPIVRRVDRLDAARLLFAYGVPEAIDQPIGFRVLWRDEGAVGGVGGRTLFATTVGREGRGRWHEAEVDLAPLAGRTGSLSFETAAETPPEIGERLPLWGHPQVVRPVERARPNVVLISIDTLRADRLGPYGGDRGLTPAIDAWVHRRRAAVFLQAVAQAPWTLPSHVSLLTGVDAVRHGANFDAPAPPGVVTLAERLRTAGYATLAVTGGGYLHPFYGLAQGFDRFLYCPDRHTGDATELATGVDAALGWLDRRPAQPFFLFLHTYEVHDPFLPREPWFGRLHGGGAERGVELRRLPLDASDGFRAFRELAAVGDEPLPPAELARLATDLYDSSVAYTDDQLGRLFERLAALDLDDRTVVVLTSDHGEMLGEHGGLGGHAYLFEENLMVPLIVAEPGWRWRGRPIDTQVRSIDVVPTVLELLGLGAADGIDGRSLVPLLEGRDEVDPDGDALRRPAWSYAGKSNHGVALRIDGRRKLVLDNGAWGPQAGAAQLFAVRGPGAEARDVPVGGGPTQRLERRVRRRLAAEAPGLRIRLRNAGSEPIEGSLSGPMITREGLKSVDLPAGRIGWAGEGLAGFRVLPGDDFTLSAEDASGGTLRVIAETAGVRLDATIDVATLEGTAVAVLEAGGWRVEATAAAPPAALGQLATGIAVGWPGGAPPESGGARAADDEVRKQLEALGYL